MSAIGAARATAENIATFLKNTKGFEKYLQKLNIINLNDGTCTAEMRVCPEDTNAFGTLHGGLAATLVDSVSSWALFSHKGGDHISVSVEMNISYLKAAKEGEDIKIEAKTLKLGQKLAFLEVLIKNKTSGELLVKGAHTKFMLRKE